MKTLLEFATDDMLTVLLVKERAKCRRRNRGERNHSLDKSLPFETMATRKQLSRLMPARRRWVHPRKREKLANKASDTSKNAEKALLLTIKNDRTRQAQGGAPLPYLGEMDAFFKRIRTRLTAETVTLQTPLLMPLYKDEKRLEDNTCEVTCRPLAVYNQLEDKVILALTCRYIKSYFDRYLHDNILSYRPARAWGDSHYRVPDFNDGARLVQAFREAHDAETIYAFDCDIKKFYDIIPHQVVRDCFGRLLDRSNLNEDGRRQLMRVIDAYLDSYNFYTNAWLEAERNPQQVFYKIRRRMRDADGRNTYRFGWVDELLQADDTIRLHAGVPQGGALSLMIADFVLNDVDQTLLRERDENMILVRFCDDMILLHTDYERCCRMKQLYEQALTAHGLYYHQPQQVIADPRREFWKAKSHLPFLWGDGEDNSNRYIGFLGYEIRRDGRMRLRKSTIERFLKKFKRLRYSLRRRRKRLSPEDFITSRDKSIQTILGGVDFYEAFNHDQLCHGSQYRYLEKLGKKIKSHWS